MGQGRGPGRALGVAGSRCGGPIPHAPEVEVGAAARRVGGEAAAASESRAPPGSACGWGAGGRATAAVSGWVNAVSTQPSGSPACSFQSAWARVPDCGLAPGRVTSGTSSPGGPVRVPGYARTSPRSRLRVRKSCGFSGGLSFYEQLLASRDRWFAAVYFYHFFKTNTPLSLLPSVGKLCSQLLPLYCVKLVFSGGESALPDAGHFERRICGQLVGPRRPRDESLLHFQTFILKIALIQSNLQEE